MHERQLMGFALLIALSSGCSTRDVNEAERELAEGPVITVAGFELANKSLLEDFYQRRDAPVWTDKAATDLVSEIARVRERGLDPSHYRRAELASTDKVERDVFLSDAFLTLASHLVHGRVEPSSLEADWIRGARKVDLIGALDRIASGANVVDVLTALAPKHVGYLELERALARYRKMSFEPLEIDTRLGRGDSGAGVQVLTARLVAEGLLDAGTEQYGEAVEAAVRRFQALRGIPTTGAVGAKTAAALGVSAAELARRIELNLERWRWMPDELGDRYLLVNVPAFSLVAVAGDKKVFESRVVVGKQYRQTPVFSAPATDIVLNPPWGVPRTIAVEDKLPEIRRDPTYLGRNGFTVYRGGQSVDPSTVDWSKVTKNRFPYQLRQAPGPKNPLGPVKINLKNPYDVYLHGTTNPELFGRADRAQSSGCIRVERLLDVAAFVLGPPSSAETISAELDNKATRRLLVSGAAPMIHLQYLTTWVDELGTHFRDDIYKRDRRLSAALEKL